MPQNKFLDYDLNTIKLDHIHGSSFRDLAHIDIDNRLRLIFKLGTSTIYLSSLIPKKSDHLYPT